MLPERYMPRKVSQIGKSDRKVSVEGKVTGISDDSFVLDDGSGEADVLFGTENSHVRAKVEKSKTVRAFCSLVGDKLKLDIVQDIDGADLNLLKAVDELYSKAGV